MTRRSATLLSSAGCWDNTHDISNQRVTKITMLSKSKLLTACLVLTALFAFRVHASDHAVTLLAKSITELEQVSRSLPTAIANGLKETATVLAGPFGDCVSADQPAGLWIDWTGGKAPDTTLFVRAPQMHLLEEAIKRSGATVELVGGGIYKIDGERPVYYRESLGWLFFTHSPAALKYSNQLPDEANNPESPLAVNIQLNKVPASVREEVSHTIALRLLPPRVAAAYEMSSDKLVQLFTKHTLQTVASHADQLTIKINAGEAGLHASIDVVGDDIQRPNAAAKFDFNNGLTRLGSKNAFSWHTGLREQEVAMISWWAQSFEQQANSSFDSATIEQRAGRAAFAEAGKILGKLVTQLALSGEIEGCFCTVGTDGEIPVVGLSVPGAAKVTEQLRQFTTTTDVSHLGILGAEFAAKAVRGTELHRFSIGDGSNSPAVFVVGVGPSEIYLTVSAVGERALVELLENKIESKRQPQPIELKLEDFSIGDLFGWKDESKEGSRRVSITSEYTGQGIHYDLMFTH